MAALLVVVGAAAQSSETMSLYADAKPYKDDPLPLLKTKVSELVGLKADGSEVVLATILSKAGEVIVAQMPRVPNLIAEEDIAQEQLSPNTGAFRYGGPGRQVIIDPVTQNNAMVPQSWRRFEYVIQAEHGEDDSIIFSESRKDLEKIGREASPRGTGFGSLWLMFVPSNVPESHFRYLGRQNVNRHATFVVGFAQDPKLVKMPGVIRMESGPVPLLYQGVAWIDQETFKIVRIRTDLLAPLPQIKLQQASSTVDFSEVTIPKFDARLWLPKRVEITWDLNGTRLGELHRYSKYRLFTATYRIVPD